MNSKLINLLKKSNLLKAVWKMPTRIQKGYWYKFLYPLIYKLNARAAVDPDKVIFVERRYDTIQDSLKLLYGDLKKNYDFTIHTHCLNQDFASWRKHEGAAPISQVQKSEPCHRQQSGSGMGL